MAQSIAEALFSEDRLARYGDNPALVCDGRTLSYRALVERSRHSGDVLRERGARPGDRILLRTRDSEGLCTAIFGAMLAGLVPVILSPRVTDEDLRYVAGETGSSLLVDDDALGVSRAVPVRLSVSELDGQAVAPGRPVVGPVSDEAFWLYSSGTTGRMKGVIHGHRPLARVVSFHEEALGIGPGTCTFCTSRISFAYAMSNGFLAPLALGATVVLHPEWPTPASTLEAVRLARPDVVFSVPSMYRTWLELPADRLAAMAGVGRFVSAGEHLPVPIAERWEALTGRTILDCYGCSETCFLVFASRPDRPKVGSVGFPCGGVETELRDDEGRPVPPGRAGRLYIRHPFLALSYGPNAAESAQARFRNGWFATGDVFRCDVDGHWHHYGREDDWLKIAGQWVSLRGVEEAIAAHDEVDQAAGVTANDTNGFLRVALFVVPSSPTGPQGLAERLRAFLDEQLPAFKRPKWIRVVDDLPRTSTGKVKKADLRRMIEQEEEVS